ncbi:MAG: hypothetical protein ACKVON_11530 [Beijerinckiaceae bacterium]
MGVGLSNSSSTSAVGITRLAHEWVILFAILAMVLGPLSLAVSRGLSAQERVNIAAGLASLPLCAPGDSADSLAAKTGAGTCDLCVAGAGAVPSSVASVSALLSFEQILPPLNMQPSALLSQLRLPPATGPPFA